MDSHMGSLADRAAEVSKGRVYTIVRASERPIIPGDMGMNQRGQIIPIMAITIGLLLLALAAAGKWAQHEAGKRAEAEASMRQWQATAMECSDSVEKASKAAQQASGRAKAALAKARQGSVASQNELARLKAEMGKSGTCSAAVQQVKSGLSK